MSPSRSVLLITSRETLDRLRNKVFIWSTVITVLLIVASVVVPALLADDGPERHELGIVGEVPEGFDQTLTAELAVEDAEVEIRSLPDGDAAAEAIEDGEVDAALLDAERLMADGPPLGGLRRAVDAALQQLAIGAELRDAGLDEQQAAGILTPREPVELVDLEGEAEDDDPGGFLVAFAMTILLFLTISYNGNSLMTGTVEEKSSRVVEILLGVVRPWHLLTAKIIALTGLSVAQVGLFVGAGLGANAAVDSFDLPPATTATVAISLLMVLIGFTFYAALYTVAGALASSSEDAQATAGPLTFVTLAAYMLAFLVVIPSPTSVGAQVLTFLPPTAPFAVPARVAMEGIPGWQVALSSVITLAATVLTVRLAGRLYSAAVLAGGKLTWRDAWQAEPIE